MKQMSAGLVSAVIAVVVLAVLLTPPRKMLDRMVSTLVRTMVYFPTRFLAADPSLFNLAFEEVRFKAADGNALLGWWVPGRGEAGDAPAVVLFHGNGGNMADRIDLAAELHARLGWGVFLFDYRGYGISGGSPFEEGLYADGRAAVELVRERGWAKGGLVLWGRSIGAAVALEAALTSDAEVAAIVLDSPFTSVPAMGRAHYPLLAPLMYFGSSELFDNMDKIARITAPLMVIHGTVDRIVPQKMGRELFEAGNAPKRWVEIEGAGHNDLPYVDKQRYWQAWGEFWEGAKSE
jgi:fermentation-respiration switch protein FrsA (DUF1100 family)